MEQTFIHEVHHLKAQGMSQQAIAKQLNTTRHQVRKALATETAVIASSDLEEHTTPEYSDELDYLYEPDLDLEDEVVHELEDHYTVVATSNSISIVKTTGGELQGNHIIDKTNPLFEEAMTILKTQGFDNHVLAKVYTLSNKKLYIESFNHGSLNIDMDSETISYKGFALGGDAVDFFFESIKTHGSLTDEDSKILNFMNKLVLNPSPNSVSQLWPFLRHNDIEINEDGDIIAWRVVTNDFKDFHSRTMDNSIGSIVEMPRYMVNEDKNQTCSAGLHVCAKSYLNHYGHGDKRIVKVLVHPADVASVPIDYNGAKMRVSKFKVLEEVKGQI